MAWMPNHIRPQWQGWIQSGLQESGLSQAELTRQLQARGLKISPVTVSQWTKGNGNVPTRAEVAALCSLLRRRLMPALLAAGLVEPAHIKLQEILGPFLALEPDLLAAVRGALDLQPQQQVRLAKCLRQATQSLVREREMDSAGGRK